MSKYKVTVKNLNLWYDDKQALKNINMQIKKNKITALIGASGCGKSTFLRCLNRMNDYIDNVTIEGKITVDDKDIYDKKIDQVLIRKKIGMVFQRPNPFPKSIYDNIIYAPKIHGLVKNKEAEIKLVEKSLKSANLWNEVKDNLQGLGTSLSGGQQQRLCIARAIAVSPEIILMDEPTSALDPLSTEKIEEMMMELKKKFTIIIVTHNMQQAGRVSDDTAFFNFGELVEFNTTDLIFVKPQHKKTEDYITGRFG